VLLFRGFDPGRPADGMWWLTPGGGVDEGETLEDAARRELFEETGLAVTDVGPRLFERHIEFDFESVHYDQTEHYFCVRAEQFPITRAGWLDHEHRSMTDTPLPRLNAKRRDAEHHAPNGQKRSVLDVARYRNGPGDKLQGRALSTEPAVPLTAGGQAPIVAPTLVRSKSRSARPCQFQRLVGQLRAPCVADRLVVASDLFAITNTSSATRSITCSARRGEPRDDPSDDAATTVTRRLRSSTDWAAARLPFQRVFGSARRR